MVDFAVQDGQTFVFIGDSITDCGRRAESFPFGSGYVRAAVELITARYPERKIAFYNEGIGGNTVEDLRNRWHDDVLAHKPDWVSVKIGINDLHRYLSDPSVLPPARFEELYRQCLETTRQKTDARLLLVSPFYISTDTDPQTWRGRVLAVLPDYIAVVQKVAEEFGALYVPTQELFEEQLRYRPVDAFCPEPVHPYMSGHLVIALGLLKALGW
ncbi:MAG: SGNH/GDSL hydrolase family protein [Armatimonadetes bacterium]|nr:SGNH/GDSL hydrolase family protein [Armatimonadota bacterium]